MNTPTPDPVIDEIREVRSRISARFGHDPRRLVAHYLKRDRSASPPPAPERSSESVPDTREIEPTAPTGESARGRR